VRPLRLAIEVRLDDLADAVAHALWQTKRWIEFWLP
jgi:hypothetical protein